jgi:hypothetical protein
MGTDFHHDQTNCYEITPEDEYEDTRERLTDEILLFPSKLDDLQKELQRVREQNFAFAEENNQLCNDIQELIAENSDLISENEKLRKRLEAQQHKRRNLEIELQNCQQQVQDELTSCEMKQTDAHFQLRFKLNTAAIERDRLKAKIQKLEQDNNGMSETITRLQKQMIGKRDPFFAFNPFIRRSDSSGSLHSMWGSSTLPERKNPHSISNEKVLVRKGHSSGSLSVMGGNNTMNERKSTLKKNPHSFTVLNRLMRNDDAIEPYEGGLLEKFPGRLR